MSSKIIGVALCLAIILALALVPVVILEKVAVAQSLPKSSFEIQPNMTEEDVVLVIALSRQMTALDKDGGELESIIIQYD